MVAELGALGTLGALGAPGIPGFGGTPPAFGTPAEGTPGAEATVEFGVSAFLGSAFFSSAGLLAVAFRFGGSRNWASRGLGSSPSTITESRSICATSRTMGCSEAGASESAFTPEVSMVLQKGQPTAISSAPVESASAVRFSLIRVPSFSSMNIRAPPAPQQKPSLRLRSISRSSMPVALRSSRGGSKILLCRPRKQGSW